MAEPRVAVLVDGDNVRPAHSGQVLFEAGRLGRVDVARIYAAAIQTSGWLSASGYRLVHAGVG